MGDERRRDYRRVGDTAKCPACGVPMNPDAYHCPRCMIYFCFKCRRRVQQRDPQFQCMNQQCEQYEKMLCNACVVEVPVMGDQSRQELVEGEKDGYPMQSISGKILTLVFYIMVVLLFVSNLYFFLPWWIAVVGGLILSCVLIGWLSSVQEWVPSVPAVYRTITENVEVGRSKCCIACRQTVQHL